jgi:hypothetical protein
VTAFVDEKALRMVFSPYHLAHVQGWFGETMCGRWIDYTKGWTFGNLTSLAWLGRISQRPKANKFCAQCAIHYKDINADI